MKGKDAAHPTETFMYLSTLTNHFLSQPPLAQAALAPQLMPRLLNEWMTWVNRVDSYVNKEAGMFGMEVAEGWVRALDGFATAKIHGAPADVVGGFGTVRDKWVAKLGWLVGRREVNQMDEEL